MVVGMAGGNMAEVAMVVEGEGRGELRLLLLLLQPVQLGCVGCLQQRGEAVCSFYW